MAQALAGSGFSEPDSGKPRATQDGKLGKLARLQQDGRAGLNRRVNCQTATKSEKRNLTLQVSRELARARLLAALGLSADEKRRSKIRKFRRVLNDATNMPHRGQLATH